VTRAAAAGSARGGRGEGLNGNGSNRRQAGPEDASPSYEEIDSNPINNLFLTLFRNKVVEHVGYDSPLPGYEGLIEVTKVLNTKFKTANEIKSVSKLVLVSLFPSWLPPAFRAMFAKPLPELSLWMNAWVTALACQWLMGKTELNQVEVTDPKDQGKTIMMPGVKVERCRYLEESGCASVCLHSCKFPTKEFFKEDMGLDVTLEPDYEDFSCQFVFGKKAPQPDKDEACSTACFKQCTFPNGGMLENGECPAVANLFKNI
jgi:hypothetical protein